MPQFTTVCRLENLNRGRVLVALWQEVLFFFCFFFPYFWFFFFFSEYHGHILCNMLADFLKAFNAQLDLILQNSCDTLVIPTLWMRKLGEVFDFQEAAQVPRGESGL